MLKLPSFMQSSVAGSMPTLAWTGKHAVVNCHREMPPDEKSANYISPLKGRQPIALQRAAKRNHQQTDDIAIIRKSHH